MKRTSTNSPPAFDLPLPLLDEAGSGREHTFSTRLGFPMPGRSLSAEVEQRAAGVRRAVDALRPACTTDSAIAGYRHLFQPRVSEPAREAESDPADLRAAWAVVSTWLVARSLGAISASEGLCDAEEWFVGELEGLPRLARVLSVEARNEAEAELRSIPCDSTMEELLPYVLEHNGLGTRLSVMRNPATRAARDAKRRQGVYFTPSDVADFMIRTALGNLDPDARSTPCLDPSCGTGVFLLALLRNARVLHKGRAPFDALAFVEASVFGVDISPLAVQGATFALLRAIEAGSGSRPSAPWIAWHRIRLNLAAADSLLLGPSSSGQHVSTLGEARARIRHDLLEGRVPRHPGHAHPRRPEPNDLALWQEDGRCLPASELFPTITDGFALLVGNPPYARLGRRAKLIQRLMGYASIATAPVTDAANAYPLFVEMMWRLTRPTASASALVVPLSIAYHQGSQYRNCRRAMHSAGGAWQCAFFDREPHGLFGEEVKTRNAILFHTRRSLVDEQDHHATLAVTPLLRWTSRTRSALFSSIAFANVKGVNTEQGIPKLGSPGQAQAFAQLSSRRARLSNLVVDACAVSQSDACRSDNVAHVYVGSTAYNFMNVYRSIPPRFANDLHWSSNPVLRLQFATERDAEVAFGILASRVTFWLWHVVGDGFHVHKSFVLSLPFDGDSFPVQQHAELRDNARRLSKALNEHLLISVNRGRHTIAFRSLACTVERDALDRILVASASLPPEFAGTLRAFERKTVIIDETDVRRGHLARLLEATKEGD